MFTQFLGALNDNILKLVVSLIIVNEAAGTTALSLASGLFIAPYVLLSPYAGVLSDKISKTSVIRSVKIFEIFVMSLGFYFLMWVHIPSLLIVLTLMGVHSAVFAPAKYGILPELLDDRDLSRGNGYLQMWTFVAIIFGTAFGGLLKAISFKTYLLPATVMLSIALIGAASSRFVPDTVPQEPNAKFKLNPLTQIFSDLRAIHQNRRLFLTMLAIAFFWFIGTLFQVNSLFYAKKLAALSDLQTGLMLTVFAFGLGAGSALAGKISAGKIEMGLVPLGGLGISIGSILLAFVPNSYPLMLLTLIVLGIGGGFFIVPLEAAFQKYSPADQRGRYLAASNVITSFGMLLGSGVFWLLTTPLNMDGGLVFVFLGSTTLLVSVYICRQLPEILVRCLNWIITHTIYKITVIGAENVPAKGGAMIVANHVSFVDPPLVQAAIERTVRFLTWRPIYESKLVNPVASIMKAIPVASEDTPEQKEESLRRAREFIQAGELVGNFAEGGISRTGELNPFRKGLEKIMEGINAPIIPAYLDEVWGSIFSYEGGKFFWKKPKRIPYPVTIIFGKPLPGNSTAEQVQAAVTALKTELDHARKTAGN